ncbi:hypothetical protein GOODEAATRI_021811 [Goodea atripinnis]|uniref:Uncharacterized protein n=1 Tax=Goodea atripinnis TaxID=208336 RepID=A0ABV0MU39_9TELE
MSYHDPKHAIIIPHTPLLHFPVEHPSENYISSQQKWSEHSNEQCHDQRDIVFLNKIKGAIVGFAFISFRDKKNLITYSVGKINKPAVPHLAAVEFAKYDLHFNHCL